MLSIETNLYLLNHVLNQRGKLVNNPNPTSIITAAPPPWVSNDPDRGEGWGIMVFYMRNYTCFLQLVHFNMMI